MIFLLLAIISSSSIAIGFKITETKKYNRYVVTMANYFMASCISLGFLINDFSSIKGSISTELSYIILLGIITGILFFSSFLLYQKNINQHGASLTSMFVKLGILIPMIVSIIVWNEYPTVVQSIAIAISLLAILLVNINFKKDSIDIKFSLIILFVIGGLAEFSNKIFQNYFLITHKPLFLFCVFFTAFLLSSYTVSRQNFHINRNTLLSGLAIGVFNMFSSFFLIESLAFVKTSVAFALFSSLSMSLIIIISSSFFKEKLKSKDLIAVIATLFSLILINLY